MTEDDLKLFVAGLSVNVMSCFMVKPRRRRNEAEPVQDRRAFRLCVAEADRDRLLDESKLPDSVIILEWFRVNPANTRQRQHEAESVCATAGTSAEAVNIDADDTMVYCTGADTETAERMDLHTADNDGVQS